MSKLSQNNFKNFDDYKSMFKKQLDEISDEELINAYLEHPTNASGFVVQIYRNIMSESFKKRFGTTVLNNKENGHETFSFRKSIKLINGKIKII